MPDLEGMNYDVGVVPVDVTAGINANWVSLAKDDAVHCVIVLGATAGSFNITINKSTDLAETYTSTYAFDEYYKKADVSAYDAEDATPSGIFTRTTGAAGTIATGATANQMIIIPVKAADLGEYSAALPYSWLQVAISAPSATDIACVIYVFPRKGATFISQIPPSVVGYP